MLAAYTTRHPVILSFLLAIVATTGVLAAEASHPIDAELAEAGKITDKSASLASLDAIISKYDGSEEAYVQGRVIKAKLDKARLSADIDEKRRLYDECIAALENMLDVDPRNINNYGATVLNRISLGIAPEERTRLLTSLVERLQAPEYGAMAANAMRQLANGAPTVEEKIQRYDEMAARFLSLAATDERVAREMVNALLEKADLLKDDPSAQSAVLDELISRFDNSANQYVQGRRVKAKLDKADNATDNAEKIRIYDAVLAKQVSPDNNRAIALSIQAKLNKMRILVNHDEKIRLLDEVIDSYKTSDDFIIKKLVDEAIARKFRLQDESAVPYDVFPRIHP